MKKLLNPTVEMGSPELMNNVIEEVPTKQVVLLTTEVAVVTVLLPVYSLLYKEDLVVILPSMDQNNATMETPPTEMAVLVPVKTKLTPVLLTDNTITIVMLA